MVNFPFAALLLLVAVRELVEAVDCIDGWKQGDGVGDNQVMATGSTLTKEACAVLVTGGTVTACSGSNGATQFAYGGCFCEFGMKDFQDNGDGAMTCLISGEYENQPIPWVWIIVGFLGLNCVVCGCLLGAYYKHAISDKWSSFKRDCGVQDEDEKALNVVEEFLRVTPNYWKNQDLSKNFDTRCPPSKEMQDQLQMLLNSTWKEVSTRDRLDGRIPNGLVLLECIQVENRDLWLKYLKAKDRIQKRRIGGVTPVGGPTRAKVDMSRATMLGRGGVAASYQAAPKNKKLAALLNKPEYSAASAEGECKTSANMSRKMLKRIDKSVNEYYLFHGTTPEGAFGILETGFKLSFVGSHRGTMFGRGCYFAECSSKSDEYAKAGEGQLAGIYGVLVCRVACGELFRVTKSDHKIIQQALDSGMYDGVLGDREASVGTYREYVVFSEDLIYPEYIILYRRDYPKE